MGKTCDNGCDCMAWARVGMENKENAIIAGNRIKMSLAKGNEPPITLYADKM